MYSHNGKFLATSSYDSTARLWDAESGEPLGVLSHEGITIGLAFSPDDKMLASGGQGLVTRLWDVNTKQILATLIPESKGDEPNEVLALAYSRDGVIASAHADTSIRLRNADGFGDQGG